MDNLKKRYVRPWFLWGGAFVILLASNMPGCIERDFPPIRDPQFYVLEMYLVEIRDSVGRQHPEIADVIASRRTRLLSRFTEERLDVGTFKSLKSAQKGCIISVDVTMNEIVNQKVSLSFSLPVSSTQKKKTQGGIQWQIMLPMDTWSAFPVAIDSVRKTIQVLVYRVNRPSND